MIQLIQGECIQEMSNIPDGSIDAVICDPPYGTTACKWDTIIPFESMWEQLKRITKKNGAMVLFGSQPFTSALVMSNPKFYIHQWFWQKNTCGNNLTCNFAPLKNIEDVVVFNNYLVETNNDPRRYVLSKIAEKYGITQLEMLFLSEGRYSSELSARVHASYKFGYSNGKRFDLMDKKLFDYLSMYIKFPFDYSFFRRSEERSTADKQRTFNPQGVITVNNKRVVGKKPNHIGERPNQEGKFYTQKYTNYPKATLQFNSEKGLHPTQKPVALMEYLIKTYTNEGEMVLDFTMGSGTTGVACKNHNRNFIGIEKDEEYFEIATQRINSAALQTKLV